MAEKLPDLGFSRNFVNVLKDLHERYCKKNTPNYLQSLSPEDLQNFNGAVDGLEKELKDKLADPTVLSNRNDAAFAQKIIGDICEARDRLQAALAQRDAVRAAGVIARSDFCNLVKSPGSTAKLPDLGFSSNLVDVLIGTHRRFCREDNPPQFLLAKQFPTNIVTIIGPISMRDAK